MTVIDHIKLNRVIDEESFSGLYKLMVNPMFRYAFKILGCVEDAEDIVAECFAKVWAKRDVIAKSDNMQSYLFRMVRNACLDSKRKIRPVVDIRTDDYDEITDELLRLVVNRIDKLPKGKAVITRMVTQGLTDKEIAAKLQLSETTVRNQRNRSIQLIKGMI